MRWLAAQRSGNADIETDSCMSDADAFMAAEMEEEEEHGMNAKVGALHPPLLCSRAVGTTQHPAGTLLCQGFKQRAAASSHGIIAGDGGAQLALAKGRGASHVSVSSCRL